MRWECKEENIAPRYIGFDCGGYAYEPSLRDTDGVLSNVPKIIKKEKRHTRTKRERRTKQSVMFFRF